jgi:hypothetical protein
VARTPKYELLVDGESRARVGSEDEARTWIRTYCEEHAEEDPDAAHVQVRVLSSWSWLTGGRLIDRDELLEE